MRASPALAAAALLRLTRRWQSWYRGPNWRVGVTCKLGLMIILEFRLVGKPQQYGALDEAIRTAQFIRNKCVRLWRDTWGTTLADLSAYCRILAQEYAFVRKL